jgi:hypothetical protein
MTKTVLVPNAPWPKWVEPAKRAKRTKRAKPSEVDAKFEQWLSRNADKENTNGVRRW